MQKTARFPLLVRKGQPNIPQTNHWVIATWKSIHVQRPWPDMEISLTLQQKFQKWTCNKWGHCLFWMPNMNALFYVNSFLKATLLKPILNPYSELKTSLDSLPHWLRSNETLIMYMAFGRTRCENYLMAEVIFNRN